MTDETNGTGQRDQILHCFERLEAGFRRRWENNPDFRKSLKGKDRDILVDLDHAGAWTLQVRDGDLQDIIEERPKKPDVRIRAQPEDFLAIFDGTLSPVTRPTAWNAGFPALDAPKGPGHARKTVIRTTHVIPSSPGREPGGQEHVPCTSSWVAVL